MIMKIRNMEHDKPLIIYLDDDGQQKVTYSIYHIDGNLITFWTNNNQNKITIPLQRLVKIKELGK